MEARPEKDRCNCKILETIDISKTPPVCQKCRKEVQFIILFLDEFNYARPDIKSLINEISDFRGSIWIPELSSRLRREWYHILVVAHNPHEKAGYVGTYEENIAQVRRFETIRLYWLDPEMERELLLDIYDNWELASKLVEFAQKIRRLYQHGNLSNVITTQNLKNYMSLARMGTLDEEDIVEIASDMFPFDEKAIVKRLWELPLEKILLELKARKKKEDYY
jgi:MoxR-like ATPase